MNKHSKYISVWMIVIVLWLASCAPASIQEATLQCHRLIESGWGTAEDRMGYDLEHPAQSKYKLVLDNLGNIFILDIYNNRINKYDSAGKFLTSISLSGLPAQERMADLATTSEGKIAAAITDSITVTTSRTENAYSAIYEFDINGKFVRRLADWRADKDFKQRVTVGLSGQLPFHYLVAGADETIYSMWLTGQITQYTPEGITRLIYNHAWQSVILGWDGFLYVVGEFNGKQRLLAYETLNGDLVDRALIEDLAKVNSGTTLGILKSVDANGNLYFETADRVTRQSKLTILSNNGRLEKQISIPGMLAGVNETGQLYVFTFLKENVPTNTFTVEKCDLENK